MIRRAVFCLAIVLASLLPVESQALAPPDFEYVSIVQLIATPERFEGKVIRVLGYVHLEFEGNSIYLHQEDYVHLITTNALWLDEPQCFVGIKHEKRFTSGYALVMGTFTSKQRGHNSLFSGKISNIVECERAGP